MRCARKYREERDKRLRPDGNDQYVEPTGRFAHFLDDPYAERAERAPLTDDVTVVIIGGGFSGLVTGARLTQAGVNDVRIIEGGGDVGGAWYWNRYPGAMCDTAAMIYLPLLEETGHMPTQKYTFAPEIFGHAQRIAEALRALRQRAVLHRGHRPHAGTSQLALDRRAPTAVTGSARGSWRWAPARCTDPSCRASPGSRPSAATASTRAAGTTTTPAETLRRRPDGQAGRQARRDHRHRRHRRAVHPAPRTAARRALRLPAHAVFDRRPQQPPDRPGVVRHPRARLAAEVADELRHLADRWVRRRGSGHGRLDRHLPADPRSRRRRPRRVGRRDFGPEDMRRAYEESDDEKMTEIRARVDAIVADHKTAEGLKPWYRQLCKRPCFHDEYLQAYNEPGVHLVDTDGQGVEAIDETGVWVGGVHYELDCLIFASGFEVGTDYSRRSGYETTGRDGEQLSDHWADGMQTLHGIHVHGFPNLFIVGPSQGANLISNITHNLVEAGTTIAAIVQHALETETDEVEVSEAAEQAWVSLLETAPANFLNDPDCTPGYYNNEGGPIGRREQLNMGRYPEGPVAYFHYIDAWRRSGDFEGLEFRANGRTKI